MQDYSTEKTFKFSDSKQSRTLIVKANGGSVDVLYKMQNDFVSAAVISTDSVKVIETYQQIIKIVPTGGAQYSISLGYAGEEVE